MLELVENHVCELNWNQRQVQKRMFEPTKNALVGLIFKENNNLNGNGGLRGLIDGKAEE